VVDVLDDVVVDEVVLVEVLDEVLVDDVVLDEVLLDEVLDVVVEEDVLDDVLVDDVLVDDVVLVVGLASVVLVVTPPEGSVVVVVVVSTNPSSASTRSWTRPAIVGPSPIVSQSPLASAFVMRLSNTARALSKQAELAVVPFPSAWLQQMRSPRERLPAALSFAARHFSAALTARGPASASG